MDPADRERYSRQILFGEIGEQGQERLCASSVVLIGCGALGTPLGTSATEGQSGAGTGTSGQRLDTLFGNVSKRPHLKVGEQCTRGAENGHDGAGPDGLPLLRGRQS